MDNEDLLKILSTCGDKTEIKVEQLIEINSIITAQAEQIAQYEEVLKWYADKSNYERTQDDIMTGYPPEVMNDRGFEARKALNKNCETVVCDHCGKELPINEAHKTEWKNNENNLYWYYCDRCENSVFKRKS
jgi:hypothetical protein